MTLGDIIDVGRCADDAVHPARVGIDAPMGAFMPKCHRLPFLVWCISGSCTPLLFLVKLGAAIKAASTTVPALNIGPRVARVALMMASIWLLRLLASSRW